MKEQMQISPQAQAPGRPKQGPTLSEDRSPHLASGERA